MLIIDNIVKALDLYRDYSLYQITNTGSELHRQFLPKYKQFKREVLSYMQSLLNYFVITHFYCVA